MSYFADLAGCSHCSGDCLEADPCVFAKHPTKQAGIHQTVQSSGSFSHYIDMPHGGLTFKQNPYQADDNSFFEGFGIRTDGKK
jgi:hypothetical protein